MRVAGRECKSTALAAGPILTSEGAVYALGAAVVAADWTARPRHGPADRPPPRAAHNAATISDDVKFDRIL